jgi:purine-cytosine permease-like protein
MFPAIAMRLLGFVALYGLALMPMGAVILCDFWIVPRLGLRRYYAEASGIRIHAPPAIAWLLTVGVCLFAVHRGYIDLYFASLPGWFLAAAIYLSLSMILQKRDLHPRPTARP